MELFMKILAAATMLLMVIFLWPTYRHWQQNTPKAQSGDWLAAVLPLGAVVLVVVLLVLAVR